MAVYKPCRAIRFLYNIAGNEGNSLENKTVARLVSGHTYNNFFHNEAITFGLYNMGLNLIGKCWSINWRFKKKSSHKLGIGFR